MGLWTCSKHGLYGGTQFCPTCGEGGNYVQLEQMHVQSTDPIGTAQERELIERVVQTIEDQREWDGGQTDVSLQFCDAEAFLHALQSRIAEVERLTARVSEADLLLGELLDGPSKGEIYGMGGVLKNKLLTVRATLSQHGKL